MVLINGARPYFTGCGGVIFIALFGGIVLSLVAKVYTAHKGVIINAVAMVFLFARYEGNQTCDNNNSSISNLFHFV